MTSGNSMPRWRALARTRIQPDANARTGSGNRRDQGSLRADGGQSAGEKIEWRTGRIGDVLVITGGDDAQVAAGDCNLRRAEHVARWMKRHLGASEVEALAVADRLNRAGKILAVTQPHEVERLLRRQHRAVAGPRMIGMSVTDEGLFDWPRGVDV